MDIHEKLQSLLDERGWTKYQLAKHCGLSEATIANIYRRNTMPSIPTLEAICSGFGISLSQFFAENALVEMTEDTQELFQMWVSLTPAQKEAVRHVIAAMNET